MTVREAKKILENEIREQKKMMASLVKTEDYIEAGRKKMFIAGLEQGLALLELIKEEE